MHLLIRIHLIVDSRLKPEIISGIFFMLPLCCLLAPMRSLNHMACLTAAGFYIPHGGGLT